MVAEGAAQGAEADDEAEDDERGDDEDEDLCCLPDITHSAGGRSSDSARKGDKSKESPCETDV